MPQEPAPRRSPWMAVGIVLVVVAIAAIAYLIMGGGNSTPPTPTPTPTPTPAPTSPPSGQLDQEILQDIGQVSAGHSVADIDQDIQNTNFVDIDQELAALDQEIQGL